MVVSFAGSNGMVLHLKPTPRGHLFAIVWLRALSKDFFLIYVNRQRKTLISKFINLILCYYNTLACSP
jgi:hypothetical protein